MSHAIAAFWRGLWRRLSGRPSAEVGPKPSHTMDSTGGPAGDGVEIWSGLDRAFAREEVAERLRRTVGLLPEMAPSLSRELVNAVARTFLSYVMDLPASEKHHHRGPGELFDHSLEVAEFALRAARSEPFVSNTAAYPEEQEFRVPRLRYAAWFFGLVHDAGKITQLSIRGPGFATWNPYGQPLSEFYAAHGRQNCLLTWKVGRGHHEHVRQEDYLLGRFLSPAVARYLGPKILSELLSGPKWPTDDRSGLSLPRGGATPAARKVWELIAAADARSAQEGFHRPLENGRSSPPEEIAGPADSARADVLKLVPEVLPRGIAEGVLRTNQLGGHLLIGKRYLLVTYPEGVESWVYVLRESAAQCFAAVRALLPNEEGARYLADLLHRHRKLYFDAATERWKLKARVVDAGPGGESETVGAILVERAWLEPGLATLGELAIFPGTVSLSRAADGEPIEVDDFNAGRSADESMRACPNKVPPPEGGLVSKDVASTTESAHRSHVLEETQPSNRMSAAPTPPTPPAPPVTSFDSSDSPAAAPRERVTGPELLQDLRAALLNGTIPRNRSNGQAYVLVEVTYLAHPKGLQLLVEKGLYALDPKTHREAYLDALAAIPCVRKNGDGTLLKRVVLRPGARPLWTISFATRGLFRTEDELRQVGTWAGPPIRELAERSEAGGSPALLRPVRPATPRCECMPPPPPLSSGLPGIRVEESHAA